MPNIKTPTQKMGVFQRPLNSRLVVIFVFVLQYSNLSPFANFLNFFHLSFGNELIIRVKTTYIMKRICKF